MVITKKAVESEAVIRQTKKFLESLELAYNDISIYILAFIHKSIVNERPDFTPEHNERLEFLWDAVLELVITDNLFKDYPKKPEWELTDIRSALVRWRNLSKIWKKIEIWKYLLLWKWEDKWWGRNNDYILANTIEAIIWAIYLDLWLEKAREFIEKYIYSTISEILHKNIVKDYKSLIQEYIQEKLDETPTYEVIEEKWADHEKIFTVWVFFWNKIQWLWEGSSKKKAQEKAAEIAYNKIISN